MSLAAVKTEIRKALRNGQVTRPEFRKIAAAAEGDGRVSKGELEAIGSLVSNKAGKFTGPARREAGDFFQRQPVSPNDPKVTTFGPAGEEDGNGGIALPPVYTTMAIGEG